MPAIESKGCQTQLIEKPTIQISSNENAAFRVLLIDNDTYFLSIAKKSLEMQGRFKVETATSVDQSLKKIMHSNYEVIVSNYDLPGRNELQLIEELKKNKESSAFILFTNTGEGKKKITTEVLSLKAFSCLNSFGDLETVCRELAVCIEQPTDLTVKKLSLNRKQSFCEKLEEPHLSNKNLANNSKSAFNLKSRVKRFILFFLNCEPEIDDTCLRADPLCCSWDASE